MKKVVLSSLGILLLIALVVGFIVLNKGDFNRVSKHVCQTNCEEKLKHAKEIVLLKDPVDLKKEYIVVVDDEVVAKLKGKYVVLFGDMYTLYNTKDKEVLIETGRKKFKSKHGKITVDRAGVISKPNEQETGYLVEDLFSVATNIHIFNHDKEEQGVLKGKAIKLFQSKFTIYNQDEEEAYLIKQRWKLLATEYEISVKDTKNIDIHTMLLAATAADEEND